MIGKLPSGPYAEKRVTARKPHTCVECGRQIRTGESYMCSKGLWDKWRIFHTCGDCWELYMELEGVIHIREDERPAFGYLLEYAREYGLEKEDIL